MEFGNFTRKSADLEDERQPDSVKRIALPLRQVVFYCVRNIESGWWGELSARRLPTVPLRRIVILGSSRWWPEGLVELACKHFDYVPALLTRAEVLSFVIVYW